MSGYFVLTPKPVSEGRPDRIVDQISDVVLDAIITKNRYARVACETPVKTGVAIIAGEVTTPVWVGLEELVCKVVIDVGHDSSDVGSGDVTYGVLNIIGKQSVDINQGTGWVRPEDQGVDDQDLTLGYASSETDVLTPAPVCSSRRLVERQVEARKSGLPPWLRPSAKFQVTCHYEGGKVVGIDAVVLSTQHNLEVSYNDLRDSVMGLTAKQVLPVELLHKSTQSRINPTGNFVIGGPVGDRDLTGHKIIVDSYGGTTRHGGGAFSGKDPSKVDRSAVYTGRYVTKNIIAAGLAEHYEIQVFYTVNMAWPISISTNTFGAGKVNDEKVVQLARECSSLHPYAITRMLDLFHLMYQPTAAYGHPGRHPFELAVDGNTFTTFTWEKIDKAAFLCDVTGP